jgi:hypothetical protein
MTDAAATQTTISTLAGTADQIVKEVAKIEPTAAAVIGMFVPGAGPFVALAQPMIATGLMYLDRALADVASKNGGDLGAAFLELMNHLTGGAPNSAALSPTSPTTPAVIAAVNAAAATTTTQAINFQAPQG